MKSGPKSSPTPRDSLYARPFVGAGSPHSTSVGVTRDPSPSGSGPPFEHFRSSSTRPSSGTPEYSSSYSSKLARRFRRRPFPFRRGAGGLRKRPPCSTSVTPSITAARGSAANTFLQARYSSFPSASPYLDSTSTKNP